MRTVVRKIIENQKRFFACFVCLCQMLTLCLDGQTVYAVLGSGQTQTVSAAETKASAAIPLKKISGSGTGFLYHHFVETKQFLAGTTYALLDDIYEYEDAVATLGSGAVLKATQKENGSLRYIQNRYGESAEVKTYVDVITRGKGFDHCEIGGLYAVPDSGVPTEYRYFCGYGGAQNCGPLYAYTYEKAALSYQHVSASLNSIDKQGSLNAKDYTVKITFEGKEFLLEPGSYRIEIDDPDKEAVRIIVEDSEGNEIITHFTGPLAVHYDGNASGVSSIPASQEVWKGNSCTLSSTTPQRTGGYTFVNWKDRKTGTVYAKGARVSSVSQVLRLQAQWKDVQKPEVRYEPIQVMQQTSDAEVKAAVSNALTITDNEPVSECTVVVAGSNIAGKAGNQSVTVTVTDKAGNVTTKVCTVNILARPLEFRNITFNTTSQKLQATLREPGPDTITETGFVWGIMNSPTTSLNNGKAKTASTVTASGGTLAVTAGSLQKGVTYYARAYAVAGGVTYYSDEISIGIGIPAYGIFTIKNNGNNTFTVTRANGTEGTQTVYYRTVNGSAVGGTHFTHQAQALTFQQGETTKTITITEAGANTAYSGKAATAYANADRTYQVELYRITGGGTLGSTARATRTMANGTDYRIDRQIYTTERSKTETPGDDKKWVADRSDCNDSDVFLVNNRDKNNNPLVINGETQTFDKKTLQRNFSTSYGIASSGFYSSGQIAYLQGTTEHFLYRQKLAAQETEDAWQHVWIGDHVPACANLNNHAGAACTNESIPLNSSDSSWNSVVGERMGEGLFSASFSLGKGSSTFYFPTRDHNNGKEYVNDNAANGKPNHVRAQNCFDYSGSTWVKVPVANAAHAYYGASGKKEDIWYVESVQNILLPYDDKEPQLVAVAPMAGGLYKQGDPFTVSLVFDEIVDSTNSTGIGGVFLDTSWGTASYAGGVNTNVLYFSGTVGSGAGNTLTVKSISGTANIKDMADTCTTPCSGGSGSVSVQVDTSAPVLTAASDGVKNGTGTAKIIVNDDKTKTSGLRYAWSDSVTMPVTGWVDASAAELTAAKTAAGLPLSIRKAPGSGDNGKWYLHVIGTYDTNGATTYKTAVVDFGTVSSPASGSVSPTLAVSADNTNWAVSRTIAIQAAGGETLQYREMGETVWKTLNIAESNITVTQNGYYTFMLTAGDQTVTQNVLVEKIDLKKPVAAVGSQIVESASEQTAKDGVYTKLTLPVSWSDEDSGVKTVQYAWMSGTSAPTSWKTLGTNAAQITYTATESTETIKYLYVKVTDVAGNTYTAASLPYTVISQSAVAGKTPGITLAGVPKQWTNDMPTLSWTLTNYSGKNYTVTQPNGKTYTTANGEFLATANGTYTVTVQDQDYGGSSAATVTVDKLDVTPPVVTVGGVPTGWVNTEQTVSLAVSDSQSGVGAKFYKIVEGDSDIPDGGTTAFTGNNQSVRISQNGTWYVYYQCMDNTGDAVTGRPANKTEGFAGPIRIDTTSPTISVSGGMTAVPAGSGLKLNVSAGYGPSGGSVTVGGERLDSLTAEENTGSTGSTILGSYTVTRKGTYEFQAESGAGKTSQSSVSVYQADLQAQNGSEIPSQLVAEGGMLVQPEAPARPGYVFGGWYTAKDGGRKWDFAKDTVCTDMTLYAHWQANGVAVQAYKDGTEWTDHSLEYTLKPTNGGEIITDFSAVPNGTYQVCEDGVDTGETIVVENAPETVRLDYYTVAFYDGEEPCYTEVVRNGNAVAEPPLLQKTGHTFEKWVSADGGKTFDVTAAISETMHLQAVWKQNGYKVTFDYQGATDDNEIKNSYVGYGELYGELPNPVKTGYTFQGWYTEAEGSGRLITEEARADIADDHMLYAYWLDLTPPEKPVLKEGTTLSDDWTNTQTEIPLTVTDGVGVTELWVSEDGEEYQRVEGFISNSTEYRYLVKEGEHTYRFRTKDAAGLESEESDAFTVRLDLTPPEAEIALGVNRWKSFLHGITFGLFFHEVQTVTITAEDNAAPVKDVYYMLAEDEVEDVTAVTDWQSYKDTVSIEPGKYVIYAKVVDAAGNMVYINSDGVVVDQTAPVVKFGEDPVKDQAVYYEDQELTVVEEWLESVILNGDDITDELQKEHHYTIHPSEDVQTLTVSDRSGNTVSYTVTILPKSEQEAPEGLLGKDETIAGRKDGQISGLTTKMEYRRDGETDYIAVTEEMLKDGVLDGLSPGTYVVRYAGTESCHPSPDSDPVYVKAGRKLTVTFIAEEKEVAVKEVSYDAELRDIPEVPEKEGFLGKWCDASGKDPAYEHIKEDLVITAVYQEKPKETGDPEKPGSTEGPGSSAEPGSSEKPGSTERPGSTAKPGSTKKPGSTAEPGSTEKPGSTKKPGSTAEPGSTKKPGNTEKPGNTGKPKQTAAPRAAGIPKTSKKPSHPKKTEQPAKTGQPDKTADPDRTKVPKVTENSKTAQKTLSPKKTEPSGEIRQPDKTARPQNTAEVSMGSGAVVVTVVCDDEEYQAHVTDTEAVADLVLTPAQKQLVNAGETIEIQIHVTDISAKVPPQDQDVMERAIEAVQEKMPGLTLGAYVDISMAVKVGEGDWEAVTSTEQPVEIVVSIPGSLQSAGREYCIIRVHDGEYAFLEDGDQQQDTITIHTGMFSTYAIAYRQNSETKPVCSLCHICPTFLGICYFVWLLLFLFISILVFAVTRRNRKSKALNVDKSSQ